MDVKMLSRQCWLKQKILWFFCLQTERTWKPT